MSRRRKKKPVHLLKSSTLTGCGMTLRFLSFSRRRFVPRAIEVTATPEAVTCKRCLRWLADPWEARDRPPLFRSLHPHLTPRK